MKEQQTPPLDRRPFHLIWPRTNASGRLPSHVTQSTHCDGVWTERKGCRPQICGGAKNRSVQCKVNLLADRHASLAREKKKKKKYVLDKEEKQETYERPDRPRQSAVPYAVEDGTCNSWPVHLLPCCGEIPS